MKYGNRKVRNAEGVFDSQKEYARWLELKLLERAGDIQNLRRQVAYEIVPGCVLYGRRRPPMKYKADFVYEENGQEVVEDVKGYRTRTYMMKRHMMMAFKQIEIRET